jgi:NiFe hydrogenase small subunit HydA
MNLDPDTNQIPPMDIHEEKRLLAEADRNLAALLEGQKETRLSQALNQRGVSRRDFVKWAAVMTTTLGLPPSFIGRVAKAAQAAPRLPIIWKELQSCTGNSVALLRSANPGVDQIILEVLSLEYSAVLMAAAGDQAKAVLDASMARHKGQYIAVFEGSVPTGADGIFYRYGSQAEPSTELVQRIARDAKFVVTAGTCAAYGGIPMASPNPTTASGIKSFLRAHRINTPVINLPACPVSPNNIVGTILELVMFDRVPKLDAFDRPIWAYGTRIHDMCERRGSFDAGVFVRSWADLEGLKKGFCLYKVGCKGPFTFNNCGVVRYNQGVSWPIMAGHGCIGCSEPAFWDTMTPFHRAVAAGVYAPPRLADATADTVGRWALGAVAVGITAHAVATMVRSALESRQSSKKPISPAEPKE